MITRTNQILIAAALMAAAPAAAVTYTSVNGAPDKGPAAGETILVDFNTDTLPTGYSLEGNYGYGVGTPPTGFAAPAGDATRFLYTSTKIPNGTATLSTLDLTSVSFYWGSIDKYNFVDVLGAGGETLFTLGGGALAPADGNQTAGWTNRRVFFTAEGDELISGLRFRSTGVAFEVDDVAGTVFDGGSGATVPEPATWAMMVMGFGLVGFARRRRAHNLTQATA
jgi:hypothetical protein